MFKFFKSLFSSQEAPATEPVVAAVDAVVSEASKVASEANKKAGKAIPVSYNADLIPGCKAEHQDLLAVYTEMMAAAESGDLEQTQAKQKLLSDGLKGHFSKEFKDLYVYLDYRTRSDEDKSEFERVRSFRVELQQIGVQITTIVNRYESQLDATMLPEFIEDYKKLGGALVDRIEREETILYPLYDRYGAAA